MLDFHPFVVHFAIALLLVSVLFDVLSVTMERPHLQTVGWWNLFLGFLASLFAVITGLYAKNSAIFTEGVFPLLTYHQYLGIATAIVFTVLFVWRSSNQRALPERRRSWYLGGAVLGAILLIATGFIGGLLVFEHGANVEEVQRLQQEVKELHQYLPDSVTVEFSE